jgi:hypothetical protein
MNLAYVLGAGFGGSALVLGGAWVLTRGRLHRTDRVGAAGVAVGFAFACADVLGTGFHPERPATMLPLAGVVGALLLPRLLARAAPNARVPAAARMFVVLASLMAGAAMLASGRLEAAALELAVFSATLGSAFAERLPASPDVGASGGGEAGDSRGPGAPGDDAGGPGGEDAGGTEDHRPGTWLLAAMMIGLVPVF